MSRISVSQQPTLTPSYHVATTKLSSRAEQALVLAALAFLCLFATTFFTTVYDGWSSWFPRVVIAALVAFGVALASRTRGLSVPEGIVAQLIAALIVLPGLLGLPGARFGLPLPQAIGQLANAIIRGPARLITSPIPARAEAELLVAPVIGLWFSSAVASAFTSTKSSRWSIVGPLFSLAIAIGCGPRDGVPQLAQGVLFLALSLLFVVLSSAYSGNRQHTFRTASAFGTTSRRVIVLLAVVSLAAALGPVLPGRERFSLRDLRTPPFNPSELPSPLAEFRKYRQPKNRDVPLFSFSGARPSRWALAVLPTYDGRVWSAGTAADINTGRFEPIGARIRRSSDYPKQDIRTTSITIDSLKEPWLPMPGIALDAKMSVRDQQDVRHNADTGSLVLTRTTSKGTTYVVSWVDVGVATDVQLSDAGFGPSLGALPSSTLTARIGSKASEFTKDSVTAWQKVSALQAGLQDGYWNERTAPGHSIGELSRMVATRETLQGNDEHYAALFAVMARSLDIPARVVVGFAPDLNQVDPANVTSTPASPTNPNALYGRDIHAWAEVNMGQLGWIPVDIRIDPRKKPKPKESQSVSEADQAPNPPQRALSPEPPEPQRQQTKKPDKAKPTEARREIPRVLIVGVLAVSLPVGLAAAWLWVIAAMKARRRKRRRLHPKPSQAIAGAWDELLERALEKGLKVAPSLTVDETAARIEAVQPGTDISSVSALVEKAAFHPDAPSVAETEQAWLVVDQTVQAWNHDLTRWQRMRLLASVKTLRQGIAL